MEDKNESMCIAIISFTFSYTISEDQLRADAISLKQDGKERNFPKFQLVTWYCRLHIPNDKMMVTLTINKLN